MDSASAAKKAAINAARLAREPLETLGSQVAPFVGELKNELFGSFRSVSRQPRSLAQEELQRARVEIQLEESQTEDNKQSEEQAKEVQEAINLVKRDYQRQENIQNKEQQQLNEQFVELEEEVAKLAKTTGVETKAHMQNPTKKIGILDIKFLATIVRFLRIKAEESKSAKELQSQRSNAKRTTGMLAWVSGKQMRVHEQGTLTLQG